MNRTETMSMILVGVGGQGAILVSKIITEGLLRAGFDVKQSEVHGMAQRGGSVSTQIRWGKKVYGPVFGKGEADYLVAFERMEAVRYADFLKKNGIAVINDFAQHTITTASGLEEYPEGCIEAMQQRYRTVVVDADGIAKSLGNAKCMNVVLFGALSKLLKFPKVEWSKVVADVVPEKMCDINIRAFEAGRCSE